MSVASLEEVAVDSAHTIANPWGLREHRVPQQFEACLISDRHEKISCYTTDLSGSGVGLVAPPVLSVGACVSVTLKLGGADTTAMKGTVRWSCAGRVGVQLERLDHRLAMRLAVEETRIASVVTVSPEPLLDETSEAAIWAELCADLPPLPPYPRLPRYSEQLPALISTAGVIWTRATIMDVSARGIGVYAGALPGVGELLHLEFTLPDGAETLVAGKVAWAAYAADDVPLMLAGITLHYAEEAFYRFILERENTSGGTAFEASIPTP